MTRRPRPAAAPVLAAVSLAAAVLTAALPIAAVSTTAPLAGPIAVGPAVVPAATHTGARARSRTAARTTAAPDDQDAGSPVPPPLRTGPPPGRRPTAAPGLRRPPSCTPPAADTTVPNPATTGEQRLQLTAVHRLATGVGQVVAVIDTGVQPDARFGTRLRGGGDYVAGGDGLDDCDGHGTAVAGILAAGPPGSVHTAGPPGSIGTAGPDTGGVVGMAPAAEVLAIRQSSPSFEVPDPDGAFRPAGDVATLADAIVLAVRAGAGVINISEAVCLPAAQAAGQGASVQAALRLAARSDVVVVAAAGNAGVGSCASPGGPDVDQVSLPGWYGDDVLAVGAVGPDDAPATFTVPGSWVDVAAPGTGLRSLAVGGGTTGAGVEGTSFAAPWVSGLAALLRERFPRLTATQVVGRILATARRAPADHGVGRSRASGYGVVDPVAALTAVPEVLTPVRAPAPSTALTGPAGRPSPGPPGADLVAAGALLGAGVVAAGWLRGRPRRGSDDRG